MNFLLYESDCYDASYNLAVEEYLFGLAVCNGDTVLYLWQNENAVIVGKNQNVYDEVNMGVVEKYGTRIRRRMTGGGTVFHDLGNLNYTFIFPCAHVKKDAMYDMLIRAFKKLGITVSVGGRNDMYVDGYKFSGNAYYTDGEFYLHHGTLLVNSDLAKMEDLLCVPSGKMAKHSVKSVRTIVKNIGDVLPDVTIDRIKQIIVEEYYDWADAFNKQHVEQIEVNEADIRNVILKYEDPLWNMGEPGRYKCRREVMYEWGSTQVAYNQKDGIVTEAKIYTDSLLVDEIREAEEKLIGQPSSDNFSNAGA